MSDRKALPTACGYDGSPLESGYWCRREKCELADECENCLDLLEDGVHHMTDEEYDDSFDVWREHQEMHR